MKCSFCKRKAEYVDNKENPRYYFCREHARKWLLRGRAQFLPRIEKFLSRRGK